MVNLQYADLILASKPISTWQNPQPPQPWSGTITRDVALLQLINYSLPGEVVLPTFRKRSISLLAPDSLGRNDWVLHMPVARTAREAYAIYIVKDLPRSPCLRKTSPGASQHWQYCCQLCVVTAITL